MKDPDRIKWYEWPIIITLLPLIVIITAPIALLCALFDMRDYDL